MIAYLPRALHLTLFAPFPSDWLKPGVGAGASAMRRVVGGEMIVFYLAVATLPWVIWRWRARPEMPVLIVYCLGMMLIYTLAIPNLGALHRFRYPYATLLIGLAVAGTLAPKPPGAATEGARAIHRAQAGASGPRAA
jgi:hypothetical protein